MPCLTDLNPCFAIMHIMLERFGDRERGARGVNPVAPKSVSDRTSADWESKGAVWCISTHPSRVHLQLARYKALSLVIIWPYLFGLSHQQGSRVAACCETPECICLEKIGVIREHRAVRMPAHRPYMVMRGMRAHLLRSRSRCCSCAHYLNLARSLR